MKNDTLIGVAVLGAGALYLLSRSPGGSGLFGPTSLWAPQSRAVPYDPIVQAGGIPSTQSGGAQNIIGGAVAAFGRILGSVVNKITQPGNAPNQTTAPSSVGMPGGPEQPYSTGQVAPFPQSTPVPNVAGPVVPMYHASLWDPWSVPVLGSSPIFSTVPLTTGPSSIQSQGVSQEFRLDFWR